MQSGKNREARTLNQLDFSYLHWISIEKCGASMVIFNECDYKKLSRWGEMLFT